MNPCCVALLESLRTASDVAVELGISRQHVHRLARDLELGTLVNERMTVFTPEDIDTLRRHLA